MVQIQVSADGKLSVGGQMALEQWHVLRLSWPGDLAGAPCAVSLDGQVIGSAVFTGPANHGISYVHVRSTSEAPDQGLLIGSIRAEVEP